MSGILCEHCTAACCRYVALPIDTPETRADFEDLRWYLIHEQISVFVEDGDWYIAFQTPCRHLQSGYGCGMYATRPRICRAYATESCDYHSGDYGWQHHFTTPEHLDEYLRQRPRTGSRLRGTRAAPRTATTKATPGRRRRPNIQGEPVQVDRHGVPLPVLPG